MSAFTGSLTNKRKADLVEIAQALGVPEADAKIADLIKNIHAHLEANEAELSQSPRFKGLYSRRARHHSDESDTPLEVRDVKQAVEGSVKKGRKSVNKALDKVANVDPASIALPESPINVGRIVSAAGHAKDAAAEQLSVALAPAQDLVPNELSVQLRRAQHQVVKFGHDSKLRVEESVRLIQAHLSRPEHLVTTAVAVELIFLLAHVVQFYDHTVFFPPPGGENGTFASLLHGLLFWLPSFALTFRLPDLHSLKPSSEVWPALAWWASTTVLPPFALSTLVSFVPQKGVARTGHNTRYSASHPPTPTADPLTFALIRLAIFLYPLTTAAPSSFGDALEISGNTQGRALGAGLLAALLLVSRLSS
ncbi:hypothetical protein DB88DRAFT_481707 [Papiliotrema laurentii]|uniref:Uncharacterized protein n=1 Tax=Papiliotrema laurentii TaxID=5418 RepID=A0AAD9L8L3_PAPLA|nr:hypothetical protein DB88DRAFT_481707 [Papiliotrema laurentii]